MNTVEFLAHLRNLDIKITLDGERLKISAPKNGLDAALRTQLTERKAELIAFLSQSQRIPTVSRTETLPLSFAQERLWFVDQLTPNQPTYNILTPYRWQGLVDITALEQSFNQLIQRHETLRTTFMVREGVPYQVIHPSLMLALIVHDVSALPSDEQEAQVQYLAIQESLQPFNLTQLPLFRCMLLQLSEQSHVLLLNIHHIISDGWSQPVFLQELLTIYEATLHHHAVNLPQLPIQYADYGVWQRHKLQGETLEKSLAYWRKQLAGAPPLLELPADYPRPAMQNYQGDTHFATLPAPLVAQLKGFSQQQGVTLFMTLLTAFEVLMYRYSGQTDLVIGSMVANRHRAELDNLIGFFVNTIVLRTDLSHEPTFLELLKRVRQVTLEAYTHQELPFDKLVEHLQPERNLSYSPFIQVAFLLQNVPPITHTLEGVEISTLLVPNKTAKFDLSIYAIEEKNGEMTLEAHYNNALFKAETIARWLTHYQVLLAHIVSHAHQLIAKLPLLSEAEQHQILVAWNDTATDSPRDKSIHQLFEAQVERTPDNLAVVFKNESLTYLELNRRANQLAHHLQSLGVGPDVLVGICVERSVEMIVGLLGILKAGGAYVPLDPTYPAERLAFMVEDANMPVLLSQKRLRATLPATAAHLVWLDTDWQQIATYPPENPQNPQNHGHSLAYVIYTSGSTGKPKGVMIHHASVINLNAGLQQAVYTSEGKSPLRVSMNGSFVFDTSVKQFIQLLQGHQLDITPEEVRFDKEALFAYLQAHQIDVFDCTPSQLSLLLSSAQFFNAMPNPHTILIGGEAVNETAWQQLQQFETKKFYNVYGPTECTVDTTLCDIATSPKPIIGRPIANAQIYLLDSYHNPTPIGIPGELCIAGAGVARGYLNRPALTAEKFIANPFGEGRLYKTGDLARYLPDGNLEFLGRIDHQVKIRGFRIELGDIETALMEHAHVKAAVVIAREDTPNDKRLVAYVVLHELPAPAMSEWRSFLQQKLPAYMIPSAFVMLEALPLTPNGKVDRRALPAPDLTRSDSALEFAAPRDTLETQLCQIWERVLKVEPIGVKDNFFELGGHSLLAVQLVVQIEKAIGQELRLATLFQAPTIEQLADILRQQLPNTAQITAIPVIPRDQKLPLSFAQERLWFIDQLNPDRATYNLPTGVRLHGTLNRAVLAQSIQALVQRHETLRTAFLTQDGQPYLLIQPQLSIALGYQDWQAFTATEQEIKLNQTILDDAHQPFDLKQLPLFRVTLFQLAAAEHVLLFNFHHIIFDGWSIAILWQDLFSLYQAAVTQTPSTLPELTAQYVDYAKWQQQRMQGDFYDQHVNYWQQQLGGTLPLLELPTDWPRPPLQDFTGGHQKLALSAELTAKLQTLSQREGSTMFMLLLAAFQLLLHRYSGQEDIIVGSPVATRQPSETEQMIGMFLNNLVLRGHIVKTATFREFLQQTRQSTIEAYTHQELPFEKLVEVLQPPRDPSRSPIFEVMLNVMNLPQAHFNVADLRITPYSIPYLDSKFAMTMYVTEKPQGLSFDLVYQRALFSAERMAYLLAQFAYLLEQIVTSPDLPLHNYSLVTPTSPIPNPADLLPEPAQTPITELIARWREQIPDHIAIKQGASQWNYRQLVETAETFAKILALFSHNEVVAVTGQKSFGLMSSMLGVFTSNNTLLMLDPNLPSYRHQLMLREAKINMLIYVGPPRAEDVWMWQDYIVMSVDPQSGAIHGAAEMVDEATLPTISPESAAYIFFTSGTTGVPKAVLGCHKGLAHFLQWQSRTFNIGQQDRAAQLTGLSFDVVLRDIFTPLISGATLCLPTPDLDLSPSQLLPWLERERITLFHTVPSLASTWLTHVPKGVTLQNLRLLFLAGEPLTQTLVEQWRRAFPQAGDLINLYGPTETTLAKCYYQLPRGELSFGVQPVGRPLPETQALVMSEYNEVCGIGEMGEIIIRTPFRSLGYLNNPSETHARFFPNPFRQDAHDWLYRSGDLGRYRPNGLLEILGRVDDQIKVRGIRIELGEIASIMGQHPNVQQQVIIAHKQSDLEKILVAYVVFRKPTAESVQELRQFLKQKLPDPMIPAIFMPLEAIPLTANGKVDRRALPAPSVAATDMAQGFIAPRDDLELQMTKIWENVLRVNGISVTDNFFELGGHSLLAVRLFTEIERVFGRNLPLATLFQAPTIEQLVNLLRDEGWTPSWSSLVPLQPNGSKTPIFCAHAIGGNVLSLHDLARHLGPDQPFYALQSQGLDGKQKVPKRLEEMAASYLEEIRTVQPHGPYYILGQSSGGLVAYEMAQQVLAQGETMGLLALIDTYEPTAISAHTLPLQARLAFHVRNFYKFHIYYLADRVHGTVVFRLRNKMQLQRARTVQRVYRALGRPVPHQFRYTEVRETIRQALSNYKPQHYPGPIVLFRATETFLAFVEDQQQRQRGWSKLAGQGLVVYDIPGAHNLEKEPHVGQLAEKLVKLLT